MQIPEELKPPLKRAIARVEYGDLTVEEMRRYLTDPRRKTTGFSQEIAERVVEILVQGGYLDDKRYLRVFVKKLDARLLGPRRIREELQKHHFPTPYVEAAMARRIDFLARAVKLLGKTPRALELAESPQGRKKLVDRLVRSGFDYSTAYTAVSRLGVGEDDGKSPD